MHQAHARSVLLHRPFILALHASNSFKDNLLLQIEIGYPHGDILTAFGCQHHVRYVIAGGEVVVVEGVHQLFVGGDILGAGLGAFDELGGGQKTQAMDRLKAGWEWQGWKDEKQRQTALVFTTAFGAHLHPQTVYNHFKKFAAQVGAPDARVHDLRHTYAVLSLQNGDDVKTVQGNLGHATAAFTLDVYGHVSERMKEDSAQRMQRYIEGLS